MKGEKMGYVEIYPSRRAQQVIPPDPRQRASHYRCMVSSMLSFSWRGRVNSGVGLLS